MTWFNKEFINFFKNLSENNNKTWFDENRNIYENDVKKPFLAFVNEMIIRIQKFESDVKIAPNEAVFRINNDIRFSKDKTPYKTHAGAIISKFGRKDKGYPGLYMQFSFDKIQVYGGIYMVESDVINRIRELIADNLEDFQALYKDKVFKKHYGQILGDKNKRLSPNFQKLLDKEPLIANKQFYFGAELNPKIILKPELPDVMMEYYHAGKKISDFLKEGF